MSVAESVLIPELLRSQAALGRASSSSSPQTAANVVPLDERRARLPTGTSAAIKDVISLIRQVAGHDSTVLVTGESGTGKEVAAHAIHDLSPRRQRPFVAVNCGAIPADLLESELFGHERGSFTGAVAARKGRFEIAEGGTLFLDEIGDMSPSMQVKLLRVLQERVFERVGNHVSMRCNVRIIAATHRNLEDAIAHGAFREDLFHRLNVFPIEMPALRARIEDLPLLIRDCIASNVTEGRSRVQFSTRALGALTLCPWTGNVRELANLIERLSIVCGGRVVEAHDLPPKYRPPADWQLDASILDKSHCVGVLEDSRQLTATDDPSTASDARIVAAAEQAFINDETALSILEQSTLEGDSDLTSNMPKAQSITLLPQQGLDLRAHLLQIERQLIEQALQRSRGTVAQAARLLNLRRTTLVEKMRKLDIPASGDEQL